MTVEPAKIQEVLKRVTSAFEKIFLQWYGFWIGNLIDSNGDLIIIVKFYPKNIIYKHIISKDEFNLYSNGSFCLQNAPVAILRNVKKDKVPLLKVIKKLEVIKNERIY